MTTMLFPEWDVYKTTTEMELDFWRGEHFRFSGGGFTNCWMLRPDEYLLESAIGIAAVTVTRGFHITELEAMVHAGLGSADDSAIAEWSFGRFCHLVDMRLLYANRQKLTPSDLIEFIKNTAPYRRLRAGEIIEQGDEVDASADGWRDDPVWKPAGNIGEPAPDPQFPSHRQYRRRELV